MGWARQNLNQRLERHSLKLKVERLAPYVKLGYKHLIAGFSTPHDEESLIRFTEEVKPQLESI